MKRLLATFLILCAPAMGQQQLGDFPEDATVYFVWTTVDSAGEPVTRATDGTVSVYKNNGTTQSTAGVTDVEDFDSLTGLHAVTIDTSADAFYETGAHYTVTVNGAVVDGVTLNAPLAYFTIQAAYMRGTDGAALASAWTSTRAGYVDKLNVSGTLAHSDAANTYKADVSGLATSAELGALETHGDSAWATATGFSTHSAADVWAAVTRTLTAATNITSTGGTTVPQTGDSYARLGAPTGASVSADVAAVKAETAAILEDTGTTIPGLIAALENLSEAEVLAQVNAALVALHLDHLLAVTYDPASKPGAADALLNEIVESDAGVARFTANALEQAPSASGGDATEAKQDAILASLDAAKGATFDTATDSLEAIRNRGDVAWASSPGGSGLVAIDHNYGGEDALLVEDASGAAVGGAVVRLYLTADYGTVGQTLLGWSATADDGRWLWPVYGDDGVAYTLVIEPPVGRGGTKVVEITASE